MDDMDDLARRFNAAALAQIDERKAIRDDPSVWERMVREQGAVSAVHALYRQRETRFGDGGERLARKGHPDLSVEALVIREEFRELFSPEEIDMAKRGHDADVWTAAHREVLG